MERAPTPPAPGPEDDESTIVDRSLAAADVRAREPGDGARPESVPPLPSLPPTPEGPTVVRSVSRSGDDLDEQTRVEVALAGEAAVQLERGVQAVAVIALSCVVLLQISVHKPPTHLALTLATSALAVVAAIQAYTLRRARTRPEARQVTVLAFFASLVTLAGVAHTGLVSFVTMILPVIVFYVGNSDLLRRSILILATCCLGYLGLTLLAYFGFLSQSHAPVALSHGRRIGYLTSAAVVEVVLVLTFVLARLARRGTLQAMHLLRTARDQIGEREAQLAEARADLERAFEAAQLGRLTGQSFDGFDVAEVIGRGGMGEVYRAVDQRTSTPVALKALHPHLREDADQVERFFREARICGELDSPHVVRVFGSGSAPDGSPYLAMELLDGQDLAQTLRRVGRLRLVDTVTVVSDVAKALDVAHGEGIVHRDLKPQNVFRRRDAGGERWTVLDFGVSKILHGEATQTQGAFVGTPSYVSPEQTRGGKVDGRSDVFSLGVLAYRCLTGRLPFRAGDPSGVLVAVMLRQPERPGSFARLPADVDLVLALALAKEPEDRFESAPAFAEALREAAGGRLAEGRRAAALALIARTPWATSAEAPIPAA